METIPATTIKTYEYIINGKPKIVKYQPKDPNDRVDIIILKAVNNMLLNYKLQSLYKLYDDFKKLYPDLKCSRSYFMKVVKNLKK
jgi:hypothetical protein